MRIYLSPNTAGRYGGACNGNLRYLGRFIQNELNNSAFESSFDELRLILSYPPMYVLPDVAGIAVDFKNRFYPELCGFYYYNSDILTQATSIF